LQQEVVSLIETAVKLPLNLKNKNEPTDELESTEGRQSVSERDH